MQVLHKLGAWPAGTWYCCTEDEWSHPRGQLLVVDQEGGSFTASLVQPGAVPGPPIDQAAIWEYDEWFHIQAGTVKGDDGVRTEVTACCTLACCPSKRHANSVHG